MKVEAIFYDFDGVMTNNKVLVSENGNESVFVNRSDGLAVSYLKELKIKQYIISTEKNPVVSRRADKLAIGVFQGVNDKVAIIKKIIADEKFSLENIVFIGNDLNDLEVINMIPNSFCPNDSHERVLKSGCTILNISGGDGVIMALYNYITSQENYYE
jgi:YrbI family 3-deoxy-D-manno-octulosonate 8-phosphate phosphatase